MTSYGKFITVLAGLAITASTIWAQVPQINSIGSEESISSANMERPNVATDSKAQPHFVCDSPGGDTRFSKYDKINGKWHGGIFAVGVKGGRYNASRLYVGQINIDGKDRSWISCKFGCKEFGSMLGQGVWLFRDVANNPNPPEQFFRHVNVYKGMGAVSVDNKYVDQGVVIGTFGNYNILDQYGNGIGSGSILAGHGGEKVRSTIASYAPRFPDKGDTKAYKDGIWHTAMNGSHTISSAYQNSERFKAGMGYVIWADYGAFPEMGDDYHHPGIGTDSTDPRYCYIGQVFRNVLRLNIWDGNRMLFPSSGPKIVGFDATMEIRHGPSITPAPANTPGAFIFWLSKGRIKMVYVSKKGELGKIIDVTAGRSPAASTDRYGNIHLVYYNNGIKYRKILVSTLDPLAPKGRVTDRTPQFRWTNTKANSYTLEITKDGSKLPTVTVFGGAVNWTPGTELAVGDYSWRVKEGGAGSNGKWSQSANFELPPVMPDPIGPEQRFASATTPTFEWSNIDPATTRYKIELFKNGDSLGTLNATGDVKGVISLTADWTSQLDAGLYSWRIQAQRQLAGFPVYSDWTEQMAFQILLPGPTAIVQPGNNYTFAPGNDTITCIWTPADGATAYKLKVLYNGSALDTYTAISDTNFPMTRYFFPGYYTLLVQPQNGSGNGPWSDPVTILVNRNMKPSNDVILDQAPAKLTWTRTKDATRYLVKLSQYNPATQSYELIREKWLAQSAPGEDPIWRPSFAFPAGAYRWSVTDYFGKKQGFSSMAYFQVKVPGRPSLIMPLGAVAGHRNLPFSWTDPSNGAKEYQIQVWKGKTKVKDTGWVAIADLTKPPAVFEKIFSFADDAGGAYMWKVRGRNNKGNGPWREGAFKLAILAAPVITAPATDAHVSGNTDVTVSWNAVTGATEYFVEVFAGTTPFTQTSTSGLTTAFSLPAGDYTVRVKALAEGESRSKEVSFTVDPII